MPSALSMLRPARAQTARISANTPIGATHSTQCTITIIASAMAWKKPTICVRARRFDAGQREAEEQREHHQRQHRALRGGGDRIAGDDRGERIGPAGRCGSGASPAALRKASASAGSRGISDSASGATTAVNAAPPLSSARNTTIDAARGAPEAAASLAVFTPTMTSASTSGTTVICSAFNHSRPTGCTTSATLPASAGSVPGERQADGGTGGQAEQYA